MPSTPTSTLPPQGYYDHPRPEVVALIPSSATRILELGCAGGALGAAVKQRQACHFTGIEYVPEAAQRAAARLDRVLVGDCETMDFAALFGPQEFDCLVAADVLEHLRDPEAVLTQLRPFLAPDATIVTSIPNVRNLGVLQAAVEGNWTYQNAGILDRTHLRFFTLREIRTMFQRLGFEVEYTGAVEDLRILAEWDRLGRPNNIRSGSLEIHDVPPDEMIEFFVIQWLVRARAAVTAPMQGTQPSHPLTSIVILTFNELEYTRQCVDSVLAYTSAPFELIFVDNASSDGTLDYLQTIAGAKLVRNPENLGFAGGNNQGLALAKGEYVVLLNNDAIVTAGWLDRLLAPMERDARIGFVGPRSNYVAGPQVIPNVPYTSAEDLQRFAAERALAYVGQGTAAGFIVGFCLALRSAVIDKIGGLDTQFGSGNFEDNDFCLRAVLAGWAGWIADDAFVHHFGHRTFIGAGIDWNASMRGNARIFAAKWDVPLEGEQLATYSVAEIAQRRTFRPDEDRVPLPTDVDFIHITPSLAAYYRGVQLLNSGQAAAAIRELELARDGSPDAGDFHNALGAAYFEAGNLKAAVTSLSRAAELAPDDLSIAENLAAAREPLRKVAAQVMRPARRKKPHAPHKNRRR